MVLGGDKSVGRPRCVEHAWQLREAIRQREPRLTLGGWANPYGNPVQQADFLEDPTFTAEFFLTQIVSHLRPEPVEAFLGECVRRNITLPGIFGVFYYRSPNRKTLETLSRFLPVPVDALAAEFAAGSSAVDICARTIREMRRLGIRHFYISNLPVTGTAATLDQILARAEAEVRDRAALSGDGDRHRRGSSRQIGRAHV